MKATTCRVRWTRLVAAFMATGFLNVFTLALSTIISSAAAAPITRADSVFPVFDSAADLQSVVDYWTPERLVSARPPSLAGTDVGARLTLAPAKVLKEDKLKHQTGILSPPEVARHPHTSIGKVFFTLNGFDHVCSACAVTSEGHWGEGSRQLVVTAGHCVNDGFRNFASNFVFAPGYSDGIAPAGLWAANMIFTTNEWHSGSGTALARDVGFARVKGTGQYAGAKLHDVVDALDIAFTESYPEDGLNLSMEPTTGSDRALFGYGVLNWGGESQVRTLSQVDHIDPNFSPSPLGAPSTHTGGASGGPWLVNYESGSHGNELNVINGVNSYMYSGTDRIYSPQFDDLIHQFWAFAATQHSAIPEPSSLTLLGLGCVAIAARRRRASRSSATSTRSSLVEGTGQHGPNARFRLCAVAVRTGRPCSRH